MNIYALSSGRGPSGIAIVRISGKDTLKVCKNFTKLKEIKSNEVNYCQFYDPKNDKIIDPEALLLWFPAPNSYTGDDLAEFQVHGSNAVINALLKALSEQENCRLAEPGEFTKIAFQNNKNIDKLINLVKAKLSKKFTSNNSVLITRERHRIKLKECLKEIEKFLKKDPSKDLELAAEDLRMATQHLGSIVGKVDVEEILGSIFKDFCIGK